MDYETIKVSREIEEALAENRRQLRDTKILFCGVMLAVGLVTVAILKVILLGYGIQ